MVQHYGSKHAQPSYDYYISDVQETISQLWNVPSIVQWEAFNEADMVADFNASDIVQMFRQLDSHRLVDTDSGGPANDLHVGDVNDVHTCILPLL